MLEIRLLGGFEVHLDGDVVELASRPAKTRLAYLALHGGANHRREMLAGLGGATGVLRSSVDLADVERTAGSVRLRDPS